MGVHYVKGALVQSGTVDGFEALLRWRMPNGRIGQPASLEAAFEDLEVAASICIYTNDHITVETL